MRKRRKDHGPGLVSRADRPRRRVQLVSTMIGGNVVPVVDVLTRIRFPPGATSWVSSWSRVAASTRKRTYGSPSSNSDSKFVAAP